MNAAAVLKKAFEYNKKSNDLLAPISEKLAAILEDNCVHIAYQPGDGLVVAYREGMDNAAILFLPEIDELLAMNKEHLLSELDKAGI